MRTHLLIVALLLAGPHSATADSLFEGHAPIEAELSGPLHTLLSRAYRESREELPFTLSAGGVTHEIQVRIRGKSRVGLCTFPPLRLNFPETGAAGTPFEGQDKLKLVTHCSNSRFAEGNVLEEYAVYRVFNLLTDTSYRVRPLRLRYRDSEDRTAGLDEPRHAFLIEPKQALAARTGGTLAELPGIKLSELEPAHAALVYVFQYLVGNTDWSFATATGDEWCCHNVTPLNVGGSLSPVPYDFDMTGLVAARYATPHPDLRQIDRVTQRLYRGYCTDRDILRRAIRHVVANREAILGIIDGLPGLSANQKKRRGAYLERFFKEAADEERLVERFEHRCLG